MRDPSSRCAIDLTCTEHNNVNIDKALENVTEMKPMSPRACEIHKSRGRCSLLIQMALDHSDGDPSPMSPRPLWKNVAT